ncbi:MAG TPA: DNA-processing protein DprA [Candidatus Krumholzibacterium sp.]|nr:DNA-processing protein DprA [Candidatus Krumholzibacterium sp.]
MCSDFALAWIRILTVRGVGPGAWSGLAADISPQKIALMLESPSGRERLSSMVRRGVGAPSDDEIKRILRALEKDGSGALAREDDGYPRLLRETGDPPPLLYYSGDPSVLGSPAVCIVGSRKASRRGMSIAGLIGGGLADAGFLVVSGMARGIDSRAHEGALRSGGPTVAVLGCGIDVLYPPENARLAVEIAANGCLLSELPPGTPPLRHNFPRRNRILSGLSLGVVVVEAAIGSGAMGTAGWAADQGREVFAVPGPVDWPGSRGPHRLIRDGAWLVEERGDILDVLRPGVLFPPTVRGGTGIVSSTFPQLHGDEKRVAQTLGLEPKHVDEIVQFCHISATTAMSILLGLELEGIARSCGGGRWARASR